MLFRTVYGPELQAIYMYFIQHASALTHDDIRDAVLLQNSSASQSPQSVDDALSFLLSAHILQKKNEYYSLLETNQFAPRLLFIKNLMLVYKKTIPALHILDPLYFHILDEIFIKRDIIYVEKLHTEVNALHYVKKLGGINSEKLQSWRRVMAYLGIGQRAGSGFYCIYQPELLLEILHTYNWQKNSLQYFLENYFNIFLPFENGRHELAKAIEIPLTMLRDTKRITLYSQQDAPQKSYLGAKRIQYISMSNKHERK